MNDALTPQDRNTDVARKIRMACEQRLDSLRIRNDNLLPPDETATLRGEIKAIKNILVLLHGNGTGEREDGR